MSNEQAAESGTKRGHVTRMVRARGFGFIRAAGDDPRDFFFHKDSLIGVLYEELEEGQTVQFLMQRTDKGWRAEEVRMVEADGNC